YDEDDVAGFVFQAHLPVRTRFQFMRDVARKVTPYPQHFLQSRGGVRKLEPAWGVEEFALGNIEGVARQSDLLRKRNWSVKRCACIDGGRLVLAPDQSADGPD